jgi:hypothetical protein
MPPISDKWREALVNNPAGMRPASTGSLWPLLLASSSTYLLWQVHTRLMKPLPRYSSITGFFNIPALRFKLFEEGPIPFFILGVFLFGVCYLIVVMFRVVMPINHSWIAEADLVQAVNKRDDATLVSLLNKRAKADQLGFLGQRLLDLRGRHSQDQDLSAVIALKNDRMAADEDDFSRRFVALTWSEWALPLLGFLGTVVGIGAALGRIQAAVQVQIQSAKPGQTPDQIRQLQTTAANGFNAGFQDMALAFDTTFIGLCGLLIVGMGHMYVKKRLATQLLAVGGVLTRAVSQWKVGEDPVVARLAGLQAEMALLALGVSARVDQVGARVEEFEAGANRFREETLAKVMTVVTNAPRFKDIADALLRPVTEAGPFGKHLSESVSAAINKGLGSHDWKLTGIAPCLEDSKSIAATVFKNVDKSTHKLTIDLRDPASAALSRSSDAFLSLFATDRAGTLLGRTDKRVLAYLGLPSLRRELAVAFDADHFARPFRMDGKFVVVTARHAKGTTEIQIFSPTESAAAVAERQLQPIAEWGHLALHPSGTLVVVGRASAPRACRLVWARITKGKPPPAAAKGATRPGSPASDPKLDIGKFTSWELPDNTEPSSFVLLSDRDGIFVDSRGEPHYWNAARPATVRLKHPQWQRDPAAHLVLGNHRWVAVFANKKLRWWHISLGADFTPYGDEPLEAGNIAPSEHICVGDDGSVLLAISGDHKDIIGWNFPVLVRDS